MRRAVGRNARTAFTEVANGEAFLFIPVIAIAELIFTVENKPVRANLAEILNQIQSSPNIGFVDLDLQTVLQLRELTEIPEMHDRMMVASALKHNASLITLDEAITKSKLVDVVW